MFETWAVAEAVKINLHLRLDARLFFWRDKIGSEVDLLVEHGSQLRTVEFKAGQTVAGDWFGSLRKYAALRQTAASAAHAPAQPAAGQMDDIRKNTIAFSLGIASSVSMAGGFDGPLVQVGIGFANAQTKANGQVLNF